MLIGSESHVSPKTMNSEILPENCTVARNDYNDEYGGVIVIYKKHLTVEENHFEFTGGSIIPIKMKTFEKSVIICACYRSPNNDNASVDCFSSHLLTIVKNTKITRFG